MAVCFPSDLVIFQISAIILITFRQDILLPLSTHIAFLNKTLQERLGRGYLWS